MDINIPLENRKNFIWYRMLSYALLWIVFVDHRNVQIYWILFMGMYYSELSILNPLSCPCHFKYHGMYIDVFAVAYLSFRDKIQ